MLKILTTKKFLIIWMIVMIQIRITVGAQEGLYDTTFGNQGANKVNYYQDRENYENSIDLIRDSVGNIYLAGQYESNSGDWYMVVTKFNVNGMLDTSFAIGGTAFINFNLDSTTGRDEVVTMEIQDDGKILVAGSAQSGEGYLFAVARLNPSGFFDTGFSGDGKTTVAFSPGITEYSRVEALRVLDTGEIMLAGGTSISEIKMAKLLPNGAIDNTFNLTGKMEFQLDGMNGYATDMHLLSTGKIMLTGTVGSYNSSGIYNGDLFAARLLADGSFDLSFNGTGYRRVAIDIHPSGKEYTESSAIHSDGVIYLTGKVEVSEGEFDVLTVAINQDGSENVSFGTVVTTISSEDDAAYDLVIQGDGKIILCGLTWHEDGVSPMFIRLNPDGTRDFDFADFGVSILDADPADIQATNGGATGCYLEQGKGLVFSMVNYRLFGGETMADFYSSVGRLQLQDDLIFASSF